MKENKRSANSEEDGQPPTEVKKRKFGDTYEKGGMVSKGCLGLLFLFALIFLGFLGWDWLSKWVGQFNLLSGLT